VDVVLVCHTEFGFVYNRQIIFDKRAIEGARKGVENLIEVADKYNVKVTFAVCPEVAEYLPSNVTKHEVGLHLHPGWQKFEVQGFSFWVGDAYLKSHCKHSVDSTVLRDYSYEEQFEMITVGKEYLADLLGVEPKSFVAGRWAINNDTVKALIKAKITRECSAVPHSKAPHYDWSELPRICMPYHCSEESYQRKGNFPLLIVPISQMFPKGNVNPELVPIVGLSWLKACFREYYYQDMPFFHICLHSPSMTDAFFISALNELLKFISKHRNINFKFVSEIREYDSVTPKTNIFPYLLAINRNIIGTFLKSKIKF
jgi:peptidoglycan/xylan/chitin deacetylase (PgdA/CDA1 family)